jgi:hypothetical protein
MMRNHLHQRARDYISVMQSACCISQCALNMCLRQEEEDARCRLLWIAQQQQQLILMEAAAFFKCTILCTSTSIIVAVKLRWHQHHLIQVHAGYKFTEETNAGG